MATYMYRCPSCDREFAREYPIGTAPDSVEQQCEQAGSPVKLRRAFTAPGVTFKGPGFYRTDSRGGNR